MCHSPACQHGHDEPEDIFAGLDEDVRSAPIAPAQPADRRDLSADPFARTALARHTSTVTFEERCEDCRGTGAFYSYSGRYVGPCYKCKGKGVRRYKTSAEQRAKARDAADRARQSKAEQAREQAQAWLAANPAEAEWLRRPVTGDFTFHADMLEALNKYGHLTERQEQAVRNATAKWAEAVARSRAERAQREASAAAIDITRIKLALDTAKGNGLKWPKLRLVGFQFSLAGDNSRNAGAVYVKEDELYLGKIAEGRFFRSRDCNPETEARILAAAADPHAAAVAYGVQTGICACCGRELTNAESVALGIGPICRDKYGW